MSSQSPTGISDIMISSKPNHWPSYNKNKTRIHLSTLLETLSIFDTFDSFYTFGGYYHVNSRLYIYYVLKSKDFTFLFYIFYSGVCCAEGRGQTETVCS